MTFVTKILNDTETSLEELLEKRNRLRNIISGMSCENELEDYFNNTKKFKKYITVEEVKIDDLCKNLIFKIKGTCTAEENEEIRRNLSGQLSDGLFERFECFSWNVEKE